MDKKIIFIVYILKALVLTLLLIYVSIDAKHTKREKYLIYPIFGILVVIMCIAIYGAYKCVFLS
jgi:hydrogenase-4 membrane subunit HyfE